MEGTGRKMIGLGYGTKFSDGDLRELSRRSGISFDKLQEALGTLKQYRLKDGLLQRSTFVRPTGTFEFLTVVPEGNWRSVEFGGVTRRMTLRRHVVLTFHCTPVGPHRGRDPTVQAIIDAGCWWSRLYQDVVDVCRLCQFLPQCQGQPVSHRTPAQPGV